MWTEYNDDFKTFYKHFLEKRELYSCNHGILSRPELPPPKPTLYPVFRGYPLSILLYILMIINLIFFHRLKQENSMRKMEKFIFHCRLPAITPQPTVGTSNAS